MAAADNVDAGKDNTSIDSIVLSVERRALQIIERGLRMRKAGVFWNILRTIKMTWEDGSVIRLNIIPIPGLLFDIPAALVTLLLLLNKF